MESYLVIINIITFLLYGVDKYKAKKHHWRISEKALFILAAAGGAAGAYVGMYIFHHKTKKWLFKLGIPLVLVIQIVLLVIKNSI